MIRILTAREIPDEEIFERNMPLLDVSDTVREIIETVRKDGDRALSPIQKDSIKPVLIHWKYRKKKLKRLLMKSEKTSSVF